MKRFIINLLALIAVVVVNALANILPINGQTSGEISDKLNVLFTPAGYVFSIWSFIYLLLFIWVIRGGLKSQRDRSVYRDTSALFVISCLFNITWIFVWHYEIFIASVIVIIGLLISLILIYTTITRNEFTFFDRFPFSVYMGWVSVATIANIAYTLTYYDWNGFGLSSVFWTVLLLIVATLLALTVRYRENDWAYPLVFIWAFIGIAVRNSGEEPVVVYAAYILAAVIAIGILVLRNKNDKIVSSRS
ncbi:tryptophan-rich sensory protein [Jeotgalibacillus sp. S-D1]|uniref:tryptophan-rich sensory protein n=1 Tax=Jeotgalibacillus sp. S-D1 TaxID=2552189 RepID=UPI001059F71F|nr:tryptophan-rich sensory protein [Jeotgalibacillus sp. S-D1]TDL30724.1 tryptophan-rich sensory protein [Jeotgalibacillus sp. S-D1]